ncbi:MAG: hypothetical protein IMY86_12405, partial [Chloroflexi bacterium]|nr:hypothetical protein [Chloroflexota bacterium]
MKEIEGTGTLLAVFPVQVPDTGLDLFNQRVIAWHVLFWRIGKIGEQGKTQVRVRIPQEMKFQLLQQGLNFVSVGQE